MDIINREDIEWSNVWIEKAYDKNRKRILLIGDSLTRHIRKSLNQILSPEYVVDLIANSYDISDYLFENDINNFFLNKEYYYEYILIQITSHHGFSSLCSESFEYEQIYIKYFQKFVDFLKKCSSFLLFRVYRWTCQQAYRNNC